MQQQNDAPSMNLINYQTVAVEKKQPYYCNNTLRTTKTIPLCFKDKCIKTIRIPIPTLWTIKHSVKNTGIKDDLFNICEWSIFKSRYFSGNCFLNCFSSFLRTKLQWVVKLTVLILSCTNKLLILHILWSIGINSVIGHISTETWDLWQ